MSNNNLSPSVKDKHNLAQIVQELGIELTDPIVIAITNDLFELINKGVDYNIVELKLWLKRELLEYCN